MATSTAAMVEEMETTRQTLEERIVSELTGVVDRLDWLRGEVADEEKERDLQIRQLVKVTTRDRAAECARLSRSRVEQILGGRARG